VDSRACLDDVEKRKLTLLGLELPPLGRPARNQLIPNGNRPEGLMRQGKKKKKVELQINEYVKVFFSNLVYSEWGQIEG
jgi:hypothetical protein